MSASALLAPSLLEDEDFVEEAIRPFLRRGAGTRPRRPETGATVVRRRTDGRHVVEYRAGRARVFAKLYPDRQAGAAAFRVHERLWSAGFGGDSAQRIPEPLGYLSEHGVLLLGPAAGREVRLLALPALADVRRAARWLARLHCTTVDLGACEDEAQGVLRLARQAATATALRPDLEEVVRTLLDTLAARHAEVAPDVARAPTHGRFSLEHVHASSRCVTVVDLDRAANAAPAKDVGELLHRLRWRAGRRGRAPEAIDAACAAFVREYRRHSPCSLEALRYHWSFSVVWSLLLLTAKRIEGKGWDERSGFLLAELDAIPARAEALLAL